MNQIRSTMGMENLCLTPDTLAHTIFALFICVLKSLLLVFWGLYFLHQWELIPKVLFFSLIFLYQQDSIPKVVESLHYFGAQIPHFISKFRNQFHIYSLTLCSQHLQKLYFFQKYYM